MKVTKLFFTLFFLFSFTGCGKNEEPAPLPAASSPLPSEERQPVHPAALGTVQGTVLFEGASPSSQPLKMGGNPERSALQHGPIYSEELLVHDGKLQNAVVYIKAGLETIQTIPSFSNPVLINQQNCVFTPHVVAAQAGQPIELLNSDATLHNVNAQPKNSRGFNLGFPVKGLKRTVKFEAPEVTVPIRCDLHPWMKGYIAVVAHPYFQVTVPDGKFTLKEIPPGTYEIEAWHEKLGAQTQTVELGPNETKQITFSFKQS